MIWTLEIKLVLSALVLMALAAGLWAGQRAMGVSESDAIAAQAARYRAEAGPGAAPGDCRAVPGRAHGAWLIVACGPVPFDPARHREYHLGRFGGVIRSLGPRDWATTAPVLP